MHLLGIFRGPQGKKSEITTTTRRGEPERVADKVRKGQTRRGEAPFYSKGRNLKGNKLGEETQSKGKRENRSERLRSKGQRRTELMGKG